MNNQFDFLDMLTIVSFVIELENLELNIQQNDSLDRHLTNQDEMLLKRIIEQNEEIIKLLKDRE